jgi:HEAT repeat protein
LSSGNPPQRASIHKTERTPYLVRRGGNWLSKRGGFGSLNEGMPAKRVIIIGASAIALATVICMVAIGPRPPKPLVVNGKSIETWSMEANGGNSNAVAIIREVGPKAVPNLVWQLGRKESFLHRTAWQLKPKLPATFQAMIVKRFGAPHPEWISGREAAAFSLGLIGPAAEPAIPKLTRALDDKEGNVGWKAAAALGGIGPNSAGALIGALKGRDSDVRWKAAYALGEIRPAATEAIPALIAAASDSNEQVRNSAAYSLGQNGAPTLFALADLVRKGGAREHDTGNRLLDQFERMKPNCVTPLLIESATNESATIRSTAIEALGTLRPLSPLTRRCLIEHLKDPDRDVRLAATRVLGALGRKARSARPELSSLAGNSDEQTRIAAKKALAQIESSEALKHP